MKRELLNIEGGKIKKGNNVIFDDLSLEPGRKTEIRVVKNK